MPYKTDKDKHPKSIEITISTKHLISFLISLILFSLFLFSSISPINQGKVDILNTEINRLNDQIIIYEHNQTSKKSISEVIQNKDNQIAELKAAHDQFKLESDSLSKQLKGLKKQNKELSTELIVLQNERSSLLEQIKQQDMANIDEH